MSSSGPRRVFLDSSCFLALVNPQDVFHPVARALGRQLQEEGWLTFTTNFVVAEAHALFLIRLNRSRATEFLRQIHQSSTTIIRVRADDEERARAIIFQYDDKDFSLTDATSFVIMERLRIPYVFTFDRHFAQYGLTVLSAG
jgi:predicted nucleic acid-binding protein